MAQVFDFETMYNSYNRANEGMNAVIEAVKAVVPTAEECAQQNGSVKMKKHAEEVSQVVSETAACFASVQEASEQALSYYKKIDEAVN